MRGHRDLDTALAELAEAGIKPAISYNRKGHHVLEFYWGGKLHQLVVNKQDGCPRGWLNTRGRIRRILRAA